MNVLLAKAGEFNPAHEFELPAWLKIELFGIDLSINKAVAYVWLAGIVTVLLGVWLLRFGLSLRPSRRQTTGEAIYDLVQSQIAESSLPYKAIHRWFPYVASLFLFIWVLNIVGFIPLPISDERFTLFGVEMPTWGIYAATANLSVTLALALITFAATHVEGVRHHGPVGYLRSWMPHGVPKMLVPFIAVLEVISQFMRLVSLSVRLFANMMAGHMLILIMLGLAFIITAWVLPVGLLFGTLIYVFEVAIVITIQAFVFALLSAIYIGGAIEPAH